jgi:dTDP-glucose 4,6-dehydratase
MLEFIGVLECWSVGVLECWSVGVLECLTPVLQYSNTPQINNNTTPTLLPEETEKLKKILITGGAGFISSHYAKYLIRQYPEYKIYILDLLTYAGNMANLEDIVHHKNFKFIHGDIRDKTIVEHLVSQVDVVINAAAESHVSKSIEFGAEEFVTTNVKGTQVLLDAVRKHPIERFIHISSSEVYGTAETIPMTEEHPLKPRSPYAATKAGGDRLVYSYHITYNIPTVIVRPFNNYGSNQHPEKLIPFFIIRALKNQFLPIHGEGKSSRDWIYVADHCQALDAIIHGSINTINGEVINIATGIDESINMVAGMILDKLNKPCSLMHHVSERLGQVYRHIGSTEKAERLLGWKATTDFNKGLSLTIDWYVKNQKWWEKLISD